MIIANKILYLRKKHGLTQEDLADKLNVSRQSISKWESASSIPDIEKIMALSDLFSVSTDYLLKDTIEYPENEHVLKTTNENLISIEEANNFLSATKTHAKKIALGVFLCILSPITLIFLSFESENKSKLVNISYEISTIIGLIVLFIFVISAVSIFILSNAQMKTYAFFKEGKFNLSFDVSNIIKEKQNAFIPIRTKNLIISIILFILGILPLAISTLLNSNDKFIILMTILLLVVVSFGVYNLVLHEIQKESFEVLLKEGEFKKIYKNEDHISSIYWPIVIAIYLGWSFFTGNWQLSWVVWPISGLLFSPVLSIFGKK